MKKYLLFCAFASVIVIFAILTRLETQKQESMSQLCVDLVERQYTYLYNKSCDPSSENTCDIDPELLGQLNQWKKEHTNNCYYHKHSFKK